MSLVTSIFEIADKLFDAEILESLQRIWKNLLQDQFPCFHCGIGEGKCFDKELLKQYFILADEINFKSCLTKPNIINLNPESNFILLVCFSLLNWKKN